MGRLGWDWVRGGRGVLNIFESIVFRQGFLQQVLCCVVGPQFRQSPALRGAHGRFLLILVINGH